MGNCRFEFGTNNCGCSNSRSEKCSLEPGVEEMSVQYVQSAFTVDTLLLGEKKNPVKFKML